MTERPASWFSRSVGDVVNIQNGYAFKSAWFVDEGVALARGMNIAHGSLDWQDRRSITVERALEFERFQLCEGDLLLALDRPIISTGLKWAVVTRADLPCLLLQRVARLRASAPDLLQKFLQQWLQSPQFVLALSPGRSIGVPHISTKEISGFEIPLPPVDEQREIIRVLDIQLARLDTVLAAVQAVRDRADQLRRSLLHAAFTGQLTQPDPSRGIDLPGNWVSQCLSDLGTIITGSTPKTKNEALWGGEVPFITPGDIDHMSPVRTTTRYLTEQGAETVRVIPPTSLVVTCIGNIGRVGLTTEPSCTNQQINSVVAKDQVLPTFLLYALSSPSCESEMLHRTRATTVAILNKSGFSKTLVPLPPLGEQNEIVRILDTQLAHLEAALRAADQVEAESGRLRRSLLQAAFTGELTKMWRQANG